MSKSKNKDLVSKGLSKLLGGIDNELKNSEGHLKTEIAHKATGIQRVPVEKIEVNPKQPRRDFDEAPLKELADSIRIHDIIQPLTVSVLPSGKYRLIAGERRFRASKMAGLADVPVYVREASDSQLLELALLENLQREDLNAIEVALSYSRLMEELSYTQEQMAERISKDRSTVTNYLRLLKLPPDIQIALRANKLTIGHAKAILSLEHVDQQLYLFKEVTDKSISVRQAEAMAQQIKKAAGASGKKIAPAKPALPPAYKKIEDTLSSHFSTKVLLKNAKNGAGSVTIEYYSLQELNKLLQQLGVQVH